MGEKRFVYPTKLKECPVCGSNKIWPKRSQTSYLNHTWTTLYECKSCFNKIG